MANCGSKTRKMKSGGAAFPDLTGDGKVTRADVLKGRGVKGFKNGGRVLMSPRKQMACGGKVHK